MSLIVMWFNAGSYFFGWHVVASGSEDVLRALGTRIVDHASKRPHILDPPKGAGFAEYKLADKTEIDILTRGGFVAWLHHPAPSVIIGEVSVQPREFTEH